MAEEIEVTSSILAILNLQSRCQGRFVSAQGLQRAERIGDPTHNGVACLVSVVNEALISWQVSDLIGQVFGYLVVLICIDIGAAICIDFQHVLWMLMRFLRNLSQLLVSKCIVLVIDYPFTAVLATVVATTVQLVLKHHRWLNGQPIITAANLRTTLLSVLALFVQPIHILVDILPILSGQYSLYSHAFRQTLNLVVLCVRTTIHTPFLFSSSQF